MKKKVLLSIFLFSFLFSYGQLDKAIANTYIKRANKAIEEAVDFTTAAEYFEKALERLDTITNKDIAILGSKIYFEIHHKQETLEDQLLYLKKSQSFFKQYNALTKNKKSEDYKLTIDELYVPIIEGIEKLEEEIKFEKEEELKRQKELKRIDSLNTVWENKSMSLSIKVDSIYSFNKNKIALFKNKNLFGLMDDTGNIVVPADEYESVTHFDGLYIFKNLENNPTKLFYYNSNSKVSYLLPNVSDFYTLSTHFGKVMLPRGNGRLVTYPNNSTQPFVYDLNLRKVVTIANEKDLLKNLDKSDVIDKYNKDGEVKIDKDWYQFGGHLGGGVHPLYAEEGYNLKGFLCSIDGKFLNSISDYQYIGAFYNGKFEASKGTETVWINQNGTKVSDANNEGGEYRGKSNVVKLENGSYQIINDGKIILGNEKLEKQEDFLKKFKAN